MGENGASRTIRRLLGSAVLALLFVCEASSLNWTEFRARARALPRFAAMSPGEGRLHGSALSFDRSYGLFLEGVARATPPASTVALIAPFESDLDEYAAQYILAPRRVVRFEISRDADFLAGYRRENLPGVSVPVDVPFGKLGRLK